MPEIKVEIAFDAGFSTLIADRTYTDVSEPVETDISISHGRADELSTPTPGTCGFALDNDSGDFTPRRAASAFFPEVKKGKPVRTQVRYDGIWYTRYTGYIDEWTGSWPDASDAVALMSVTCSTRRARLGNTAPLTSAIRAAYLASDPEAYWPLSDDHTNIAGQTLFYDVTDTLVAGEPSQPIAGFFTSTAIAPRVNDASVAGPTDEGTLVYFPKTVTGTAWGRYIGGGDVMRINTAPNFAYTAEIVARVNPLPPPTGENVWVVPFTLASAGLSQEVNVFAYDATNTGGSAYVGLQMLTRDGDGNILEVAPFSLSTSDDLYSVATDGELHHWAVQGLAGIVGILYLDGVEVAVAVLGSTTLDQQFTSLGISNRCENATMWAGHMAVHDTVLGNDAILLRARAAIAATETPEERVVRVAERTGVPTAEIDVEDTVARDLGSQPEAGRSAAEVLDEVAVSTGGVLYDSRDGLLTMQARNHRYNAGVAFTLNATEQEVQADLTPVDDHRYTKNTIEYTRAGVDAAVPATVVDQASIDEFGVFNPGAYSIISESDTEVEAFVSDQLYRYADPEPRVATVSVDVLNIDADQRALILAADIGTRFALTGLPHQVHTDPLYLFVEGYAENLGATSHTITFNTTPATLYQNVFTLDDPVLGQLDAGNVIAY